MRTAGVGLTPRKRGFPVFRDMTAPGRLAFLLLECVLNGFILVRPTRGVAQDVGHVATSAWCEYSMLVHFWRSIQREVATCERVGGSNNVLVCCGAVRPKCSSHLIITPQISSWPPRFPILQIRRPVPSAPTSDRSPRS